MGCSVDPSSGIVHDQRPKMRGFTNEYTRVIERKEAVPRTSDIVDAVPRRGGL